MRRSIRVGAATVIAALALSACGADGTPDDESALAGDAAAASDDEAGGPAADEGGGPVTGRADGADGEDEPEDAVVPDGALGSGDLDADLTACADLPGAVALDPDAASDELLASLDDPGGAFRADADLGPLTKALLLTDAGETDLPRVRYRLRYATTVGADGEPIALVRVERFNLGPAIREELVATLGEDAVGPVEEFGGGPHVAYCLESRTIQALTADVVALTRVELPDGAPDAASCFGTSCASTASIAEAATTWDHGGEPRLPATVYDAVRDGAPSPAAALDLATAEIGLASRDGDTIRWHGPEPREGLAPGEAFIDAVIDVGLGQDSGIDLVLREGHLMDDALEAVWQRVTGVATGDPDSPVLMSASAAEERPAP